MGHERPDLTSRPIRFWTVHSHVLVYRPDSDPLWVLRILHGSRDPSHLRDQVGEPALLLTHYAAASSL
jgi:plasmid stabilization system protein ParE